MTGIYRDLPFVLRNQPSFIPFETLPRARRPPTSSSSRLAVDYYFAGARLTPGHRRRPPVPGDVPTTTVDSSSAHRSSRTVVVREQGNIAILPVNATGGAHLPGARQLEMGRLVRSCPRSSGLQFVRDNNGTFVERDPNEKTLALRTFISPNFLGFGASVSARF